jgi:hypothetical protein
LKGKVTSSIPAAIGEPAPSMRAAAPAAAIAPGDDARTPPVTNPTPAASVEWAVGAGAGVRACNPATNPPPPLMYGGEVNAAAAANAPAKWAAVTLGVVADGVGGPLPAGTVWGMLDCDEQTQE